MRYCNDRIDIVIDCILFCFYLVSNELVEIRVEESNLFTNYPSFTIVAVVMDHIVSIFVYTR